MSLAQQPPTIAQPQWPYYLAPPQQQPIQRPQKLQPSNYYPSAYPQGRALKGTDVDGDETVERRSQSSDWTEHSDWEHFDAHRDRRDLYKSLEGMMYVGRYISTRL